MKAKVLTIISALILIAAVAVSIILVINNRNNEVKPANPDAPTAKIESFSYNYGSYHGGYHYYAIEEEDGKMMINGAGGNGVELSINREISDDKLEELSRIINDNKIYEWNGFNKSKDGILDGYDFKLEIKYKDGKEIKAYGYEEYPDNYSEAHKSLEKYFASFE
jgi:hypothetical protein